MCSIFFNTTKKKQIRLIHEAVNFADNKTTVSLKSLTFNLTKKTPTGSRYSPSRNFCVYISRDFNEFRLFKLYWQIPILLIVNVYLLDKHKIYLRKKYYLF